MLKIVDRMLLGEMRAPFLFGVAMFSILIIATVVLNEAARFVTRWGGGTPVFLKILLLSSPMWIVLSIPMGVLLGTLISVGRLNSDLEIVALRALGIGLVRVLIPYFIVGILFSALTYAGYELLVPWCQSKLTEMKNDIKTGKGLSATRQRESWPVYEKETNKLEWLLVAAQIDGPTLEEVTLLHFDPLDSDRDFLIVADRASWNERDWTFYDAKQVLLRENVSGDERLIAEADEIRVPDFNLVPESLRRRSKKPEDLTAAQLRRVINEYVGNGEYEFNSPAMLELRTLLHQKYAIPFTPLVFIIIALPLAIRPQRSTSMMGFGMALMIVLGYYVLYTSGQKLGSVGVLWPWLAAWLPNILPAAVGIYLLKRRERH